MVNKKFFWGMLVMALVIGMTVVGCEDEEKPKTTIPESSPTPLTGTVNITSNVTVDSTSTIGRETKTLTANVTGSNASSFNYQWTKDNNLIGSSSTYDVTSSDYDKTIKVTVTGSGSYSGTLSDTVAVGRPTTCSVFVKYDTSVNQSNYTQVKFERENGTPLGQTPASFTPAGETVTLTSWNATKFKICVISGTTKYYFKNGSTSGVETFDLTAGNKSYSLKFDYSVGYTNLVAVLQ